MSNFASTITPEEVMAQKETTIFKKKENTFDLKNYLQAKLGNDETSKHLIIRLLPYDPTGGTPFKKVWMHMVKVNKEVSKSGWKTFPCPTHNELGGECPFCKVSEEARKLGKEIKDEIQKKKVNEMEFANRAKEYWVVRCIERGYEEDGVKYWLFPHSRKNDGIYNKIMNKFQNRYETAKLMGKECNIFDLNNGRDLIVTLTKTSDGKTSTDIDVADDSTPLTTDYEKGMKWINDEKKWTDVFTVKPYDYMKIIAEGGIPLYSREKSTYVDKNMVQAENDKITGNTQSNVEDIEFSKIPTPQLNEQKLVNSVTQVSDDLPF